MAGLQAPLGLTVSWRLVLFGLDLLIYLKGRVTERQEERERELLLVSPLPQGHTTQGRATSKQQAGARFGSSRGWGHLPLPSQAR